MQEWLKTVKNEEFGSPGREESRSPNVARGQGAERRRFISFLSLSKVSNDLKTSSPFLFLLLWLPPEGPPGDPDAVDIFTRCSSLRKQRSLSLRGAGQTQLPPNKKISLLSKASFPQRFFLECWARTNVLRTVSLIDGCYLSAQRDVRSLTACLFAPNRRHMFLCLSARLFVRMCLCHVRFTEKRTLF